MPKVGDFTIECSCGDLLLVPIEAWLRTDDEGQVRIATKPDTSGLWLHAWADHGGATDE